MNRSWEGWKYDNENHYLGYCKSGAISLQEEHLVRITSPQRPTLLIPSLEAQHHPTQIILSVSSLKNDGSPRPNTQMTVNQDSTSVSLCSLATFLNHHAKYEHGERDLHSFQVDSPN